MPVLADDALLSEIIRLDEERRAEIKTLHIEYDFSEQLGDGSSYKFEALRHNAQSGVHKGIFISCRITLLNGNCLSNYCKLLTNKFCNENNDLFVVIMSRNRSF